MTDLVGRAPRDMPPGDPPLNDDLEPRSRKRRRFLALTAGGIAAAATGGWIGSHLLRRKGQVGAGAAGWGGLRGVGQMPAGGGAAASHAIAPGTVVKAAHPGALDASGAADPAVIHDMVDAAMARLTGKADRAAAWASLFSRDDVVAIKVNCLAAPALSTHPQIVDAIISGLRAAGLPDENIIIYDRLTHELERGGFTPNTRRGVRCLGSDVAGYDAEVTEAGSVGSCLSRVVSELCSAIINVPVVKDHDVAGVSIALKNHFGSINNPNKQHENQCTPQVADLNLFEPIRAKQRLVIADALTVTYDGGPAYKPRTSAACKAVLAATDAVALDAVGLDIIEGLRRRAGLPTLAAEGRKPKYIAVAADADHNLGVADLSRIRRIEVDLGRGERS